MGKFQLNKEGEDPIKIYEDTFKVANDTIETHLDKLGKQPNPISESKASEGEFKCPKCKFETDDDDAWSYHMQDHDEGDSAVSDFMKYEMESKASEDVTFGQDNVWSMMTTQQREDAFNRVGLSGIHFNEDDESNWAKYNYGDIEWYGLTPKMQDQLNKWGIGESKASGMKHEWESVESIASEFSLKEYKDNEDINYHAENALELVKQYGTSDEIERIEDIIKMHNDKGYLSIDERSERDSISRKYYSRLVNDASQEERDYKSNYWQDTQG